MRGMGNMGNLLKQAQKLQAQMAKAQEELETKRVEGSAGGGMVVAVANGKQDLISIKIDPEVVNRDDVEMLEDLIVAAVKQAQRKAAAMAEEEMQKATAGLMPGGMGGTKLMGM